MRKTAGYTHYWQVRGRGFTDKQWRAILSLAAEIIGHAAEKGIVIAGPDGTGEAELGARCIDLNGAGDEGAQRFHFSKEADPAWGRCKTNHQPYDAVVVSILTAAKKVAPDVLEISSDGGRDVFKRILAMSDRNLFSKTVKLASEQPSMRSKLMPMILRHASVNKTAQRRFLVAYAHNNPEFRDELIFRLRTAEANYKTYVDRKKRQGEKPLSKEQWESRVKGEGKNKGEKEKGEKKEDKGGAVSAENLGGNAKPEQVHGNAVVHGNAKIHGPGAEVGGHAVIYGDARVAGDAKVGQDAEVFGKALLGGDCEINGEAKISGGATVIGKANVSGKAQIAGNAKISGSPEIKGDARVGGSAKITGGKFEGDVAIVGGSWEGVDVSHGQWKGAEGPKAVQKNNLQDADVDEVLEKIVNKKGQMLSPAQLFAKFMREAKPETKERMKDMSLNEFMDVVNFMADDEEVDKGMGGKTASSKLSFSDAQLRSAAIRVAYKTKSPALRRQIALALKQAADAEDDGDEKEGKFEEGKPADPTVNMSPEDKKKWKKHEGEIGKKASRDLGDAYVALNLGTKEAGNGPGAEWYDPGAEWEDGHWYAVYRKGGKTYYLKATGDEWALDPEGDAEVFDRESDAKRAARSAGKPRKAATRKLARKLFPQTNVKVAEKWIQDAIKRPGRVREYLNVPEGQDIPMGKLDSAIEKVKGTGDHSLLSALLLAKRLKKMGGSKKKALASRDLGDAYVALNLGTVDLGRGVSEIQVAVVSLDSRMASSAETHIKKAIDWFADIDDRNPRGVKVPRGWIWTGFSFEVEQDEWGPAIDMIKKEVKRIPWVSQVLTAKNRWPSAPRS